MVMEVQEQAHVLMVNLKEKAQGEFIILLEKTSGIPGTCSVAR